MSRRELRGIGIQGVVCAIPSDCWPNSKFESFFGSEFLSKMEPITGISERRVAPASLCTSDLCHAAATRLFESCNIDRSTIDTVIFVSQTPDYILPATACVLQERLNLPTSTVAFDVNLGCSGYVYGLWLAGSLIASGQSKKTLLLVGDTCTKFVSYQDKSTAPLFGDAGSATLVISEAENHTIAFDLGTDGRGAQNLIIPSGGFRSRPTAETSEPVKYPDGTSRSAQDLYMKGGEIFNFTIGTVGVAIQRFLESFNNDIDAAIFHQANLFMLEHLRKKLQIPKEKMWLSLKAFGNTSSASIPLTIVAEYQKRVMPPFQKVLLAGFGVGYSWALAYLTLPKNLHCELIEVAQ